MTDYEGIIGEHASDDVKALNPELFDGARLSKAITRDDGTWPDIGDGHPTTVPEAKEMVQPGDHIVISPKNRAKYRNNRVVYHCHQRGILVFDSVKEFERYKQLLVLELGGYIEHLELQKPFELQPAFTMPDGENVKAITYRSDFYYEENGIGIVEDVKGMRTDLFNLKWRIMKRIYGDNLDLRLVK